MQDMAHDDDLGLQRVLKKSPAWNLRRPLEALARDEFLEHRLHLRKIEAAAGQMRMRARQSDGNHALRGPDIEECLIILPGKLCGDRLRGPALMPLMAARKPLRRSGAA